MERWPGYLLIAALLAFLCLPLDSAEERRTVTYKADDVAAFFNWHEGKPGIVGPAWQRTGFDEQQSGETVLVIEYDTSFGLSGLRLEKLVVGKVAAKNEEKVRIDVQQCLRGQ